MSAVILPFKAPVRSKPGQPARDPKQQTRIMVLLREINVALDARKRGQT